MDQNYQNSIESRSRKPPVRHHRLNPSHTHFLAGAKFRWRTPQGAKRYARSLVGAADAGYRDCSCPSAEREAEWSARKDSEVIAMPPVLPNPSLKRRANGRPPGPGPRYGVHFLSPGPGVLPSSPA